MSYDSFTVFKMFLDELDCRFDQASLAEILDLFVRVFNVANRLPREKVATNDDIFNASWTYFMSRRKLGLPKVVHWDPYDTSLPEGCQAFNDDEFQEILVKAIDTRMAATCSFDIVKSSTVSSGPEKF